MRGDERVTHVGGNGRGWLPWYRRKGFRPNLSRFASRGETTCVEREYNNIMPWWVEIVYLFYHIRKKIFVL